MTYYKSVSQSITRDMIYKYINTVLNSLIAKLRGVPWRQEVGFVYLAVR